MKNIELYQLHEEEKRKNMEVNHLSLTFYSIVHMKLQPTSNKLPKKNRGALRKLSKLAKKMKAKR